MIRKIERSDLLRLVRSPRRPLIIEVSSGETYSRLHIPGAIQLNLAEIASDFEEQYPNRDQEIILYGLSDTNSEPDHAAVFLEALGYLNVFVYPEGKDAWILRGLPTGTSYFYPPSQQPLQDFRATHPSLYQQGLPSSPPARKIA